jgi:hypothetical protein
MAAPVRYSAYEGYLIASDNAYSVPPQAYSSNIKTQMTQAQNYTDWLVSRSAQVVPIDNSNQPISSSMWFLEPSAPTNVAFNTFNDNIAVATGLPQQMSPANATDPLNFAVWGIYFPAVTGQGQLAAAVGKIQLYGTRVAVTPGQGNTTDNGTSATAFLALANSIGDKYAATSAVFGVFEGFAANGPYNTQNDAINALQQSGAIVSLNGAPVYLV